jgi:DTW domain-containing protein
LPKRHKAPLIGAFLFSDILSRGIQDESFMSFPQSHNSYHRLRQACLATATREFNARGKSVLRCEYCQLAQKACICTWKPVGKISCEFILLMHREELFKPTNTGRLIADVFPDQTRAFCWSRTEPDPELIQLMRDPTRLPLIVFPDETRVHSFEKNAAENLPFSEMVSDRLVSFILLDGTWKQSGRMFHLSRWLDELSTFSLTDVRAGDYAVRKSHQQEYVSTAEAAAACLDAIGDSASADLLRDYFAVFNQHYLATRGGYTPEISEIHQRLSTFLEAGKE